MVRRRARVTGLPLFPLNRTEIPQLVSRFGINYVLYYSFMPANAALCCQSNKADRSSWAADDGIVGADL